MIRPVRVKVRDEMQKGYIYWRTKPMGRGFRPGFKPDLTPKPMLALGVFGGKYMTDCRREFPARWFKKALFWRECIAAAGGLAEERLDLSGRSAGMVSMVLPLLFGTTLSG